MSGIPQLEIWLKTKYLLKKKNTNINVYTNINTKYRYTNIPHNQHKTTTNNFKFRTSSVKQKDEENLSQPSQTTSRVN
jgi:hypothetical protein